MKTRKVNWYRVKAPQPWRPKVDGELVGEYVGSKEKFGKFGTYKIHLVQTKNAIFYASGASVDDLFALLHTGDRVKLIYKGLKSTIDGQREYKVFELYTQEQVTLNLVG